MFTSNRPTSSPGTLNEAVYTSSPMLESPSKPRSLRLIVVPPRGERSTRTYTTFHSASGADTSRCAVLPPSPRTNPSCRLSDPISGGVFSSAATISGDNTRSRYCVSFMNASSPDSPKGIARVRVTLESNPFSGPAEIKVPWPTPSSPFTP